MFPSKFAPALHNSIPRTMFATFAKKTDLKSSSFYTRYAFLTQLHCISSLHALKVHKVWVHDDILTVGCESYLACSLANNMSPRLMQIKWTSKEILVTSDLSNVLVALFFECQRDVLCIFACWNGSSRHSNLMNEGTRLAKQSLREPWIPGSSLSFSKLCSLEKRSRFGLNLLYRSFETTGRLNSISGTIACFRASAQFAVAGRKISLVVVCCFSFWVWDE